ncbi:MAG TPA: MarR family transcriptional regulator [Rhodothermales bacterium]|nr:MarR family transcriptional regulator [Rhodothermales bacterium]
MQELSPAAIVADQLHSTAIHLLRWLRQEDVASGISAAQLSALSVIVFAGPLTMGELAAAEQVQPPTMTRLVQALSQGGFVVRERDSQDRRIVRIHATPEGTRVLTEGRHRRVAALTERLQTLSNDDLLAIEQSVQLIAALVSKTEE